MRWRWLWLLIPALGVIAAGVWLATRAVRPARDSWAGPPADIGPPVPGLTAAARAALGTFNDVIVREAARSRVPVLDLRLVCDEPADYSEASPIEPSARGGAKIAARVAQLIAGHDWARRECVVFGAGERI